MKDKNFNLKINCLGIYLLLVLFALGFMVFKVYINPPQDKFIFSLIIIACSGGMGGTVYSIRSFYKNLVAGHFDFNRWVWWYIFRPIMSIILGLFAYFLIVGGLMNVGNISEATYLKGLIFYSAIAFLAGFSFTQFANKLEEIASTIFAKKQKK